MNSSYKSGLSLLALTLVVVMAGPSFAAAGSDKPNGPVSARTGQISVAPESGAKVVSNQPADIFQSVNNAEESIISAGLISGGGNSGSSSSFRLSSTLSQLAVGSGSYGVNRADHGFWQVINGLAMAPCCGAYTGGLTGNTNCDVEGRRDILDITVLIDHVYISHRELCCQANGNLVPENGELINLADITRLIDHVYVSHAETAACQ